MSRELDSFFAEPRAEEEYHDTRLTLSGGVEFQEEGDISLSGRNKMRVALPALKDKVGILIGGDSDREGEDIRELTTTEERNYESFLRVFTEDNESPLNWDFDVGIKYHNEVRMFTRIKGTYEKCFRTKYNFRFIDRIYWRNHEGFGTKLRWELDHPIASYAFLREFFELTYSEQSDGLDIFSGLILRAKASDRLACSMELIHFGTTRPWRYRYFEVKARIRRSIYWTWLNLEVAPQMRVKRKDHLWDIDPTIEVLLSLNFDARHAD